MIALEDLHAEADQAVAVIGMTVLLSVLAHGLSAKPLATRYGATVADIHPADRSGPDPAAGPRPAAAPSGTRLPRRPPMEAVR